MQAHTPAASRGMRSLIMLIAALVLSACQRPSPMSGIEHPDWFETTSAPPVQDEAEVDALWLSAPRCCGADVVANNRIFYKACARAIERQAEDEYLVVKCLWLMQNALDGHQSARLKELIMDRYFTHKDSLRNCANCAPGDTVSRIATELASYYAAVGRLADAISLLERAIDGRSIDTSPWVRIESNTQLCKLYLRTERTAAQRQRISNAQAEFLAMRADPTIATRYGEFVQSCRIITDDVPEQQIEQVQTASRNLSSAM